MNKIVTITVALHRTELDLPNKCISLDVIQSTNEFLKGFPGNCVHTAVLCHVTHKPAYTRSCYLRTDILQDYLGH